jgi:hypothetical protein
MPQPPPPFFVVGYMHSGTTMLIRMLERHSAVYAGRGETKFFDFLPVTRRHFDLRQPIGLQGMVRYITYLF